MAQQAALIPAPASSPAERGAPQAAALARCLAPLLQALGWTGSERAVAEATPHLIGIRDLTDIRNALVGLGFESTVERTSLDRLDLRLLPCLFAADDGRMLVVQRHESGRVALFDGSTGKTGVIAPPSLAGLAVTFSAQHAGVPGAAERSTAGWFLQLLKRFHGTFGRLLAVTLAIDTIALVVPICTMVIYDRVIGHRSTDMLGYIVAGLAILFAGDFALRALRGMAIGAVAARLDYIVGVEAFKRILDLPLGLTERAPLGQQIARLKQFETLREFFAGPLVSVALELPFAVLFIGAIAVIAGPVALVPLALIAAFVLFGWFWFPRLQDQVRLAGRTKSDRQSFLLETIGRVRDIRVAAADDIWRDRFRQISAASANGTFGVAQRSLVLQTVAHSLMVLAGVAVLAFGTHRVLNGAMTVGALVATMALVWRVLAPLQTGFLTLTRLEQVKVSLQQLNSLMRLPTERASSTPLPIPICRHGAVQLERVSFRYAPESNPVLFGVSTAIRPGEMVAIAGANGSGKSTLLKLILGTYRPQAGTVLIDEFDTRQADPAQLRTAIAYVPQTPQLFHGTVAQNLRLAEPTASDVQLEAAVAEIGLLETIRALPRGFDTRLNDSERLALPPGFAQRLSIARALLRRAPILLLDEPANALDQAGDAALMDVLARLRGRCTVIMVSHRPSHIRLADRAILLNQGTVAFEGPPESILPLLQRGSN